MNFDYGQLFSALVPETIIVVTAFVALAVDLLFLRETPNRSRLRMAAAIVALGCIAAIVVLAQASQPANLLNGMLVLDGTARFIKQVILVLTIAATVTYLRLFRVREGELGK